MTAATVNIGSDPLLDVPTINSDVVSISEPRTPPPVAGSIEALKRKLNKDKLRIAKAKLHKKLRQAGWRATPEKARWIAWILTEPRRWHGEQWACLTKLWQKESSWQWYAKNPESREPAVAAYGIPQSLPGKKMATAGRDWLENAYTQIKWGLKYIKDRYFSPCGAWRHSLARNWY